jgi:DUF1680 family protein
MQLIRGVVERHRSLAEERASSTGEPNIKTIPFTEQIEFHAIPYFAWANRGVSQMEVWIKRETANRR